MTVVTELTDLDGWLEYIQSQHVREIDMSLARVQQVYQRLLPKGLQCKVISIAGTNGKGSTAELLSSIYHNAGYRVGKFTSPHLLVFNERFEVSGVPVADDIILTLLPRIEQVLDKITLTYFEYCTLLAILIFAESSVDIAVMEVGLGGRLDSVNVLDADVSIITNISIDHTDWLGDSIELISLEKAGITRPGKPCVIGMHEPPQVMLDFLAQNNVPIWRRSVHFDVEFSSDLPNDSFSDPSSISSGNSSENSSGNKGSWCWQNETQTLDQLPFPFQQNDVQIDNAAAVIQAIQLLNDDLPIRHAQLSAGISSAVLAGRCQIIQTSPLIIVDVSHNEASVARLANFIKQQPFGGKCYAVCGMLEDKKIAQSLKQIAPSIDVWSIGTINHPRGADARHLAQELHASLGVAKDNLIETSDSIVKAYDKVVSQLFKDDCLVVFGSFFVVSDIIAHIQTHTP